MKKNCISVKHFSNSFKGEKPPICRDFGESNTDKSTYRPDLSILRAYQGSKDKKLVYDFPDGKDNGEIVMTYIRDKGLDVSEVDAALERIKSSIDEKVASSKEKDELLDSVKEIADSLKKDSSNVDVTTEKSEN